MRHWRWFILSLVPVLVFWTAGRGTPSSGSGDGTPRASNECAAAEAAPAPTRVSFNDSIQPILSENCYLCHGPDPGSRKAGLRLDRAEFAFAKRPDEGTAVIIKGDPGASELIKRITAKDPDDLMPPPETHKKLKPSEIALITQWVKEGAQYEPHWSLIKPVRPAPPQVFDAAWTRNPIDSFVLSKLEKAGLRPEEQADKRSLIRRVTLDLTGFPPKPEDVEAFVADASPDAYEKVVDRLLADPHYGEHMARYWLDAARYADTHGLHYDNYRSIWPYRDWVINAFNTDLPFNDFVVDQIAGDLLPDHTTEQLVATGFNRCNVSTNEGGVIQDEVLANYANDRVSTTSTVFMGLTMGCCACHDHKFDPLAQKEFYEMSAFFRNTTQKAMDGNVEDTPPSIRLPSPQDRARYDALPGEIEAVEKQTAARAELAKAHVGDVVKELAKSDALKRVDPRRLVVELPLNEGKGASVAATTGPSYPVVGEPKWVDGPLGPALPLDGKTYADLGDVGDFDTHDAFSYGGWVRLGDKPAGSPLARLDHDNNYRGWDLYFQDAKPAAHFIHNWPQNAMKVVADKPLKKNTWLHVFVTYDGTAKASGVKMYVDGMPVSAKPEIDTLTDTIKNTTPLELGRRGHGEFATGMAVQDFRVYHRLLTPGEIKVLSEDEAARSIVARGTEKLTGQQQSTVLNAYLQRADPEYSALKAKEAALTAEQEAIRKRSPATLVMQEKPDAPFAYVLKRGQYDQLGDKVFPAVPAALPPLPPGQPANRLGLARWLVSPDHPLLARVTVNRLWQQVFGIGIVRTSEDFGVMGERPVNQPLLDWLAVEFRESGWDVKHMMRLMVTSAAYRQSARVSPEKRDADPENRLASRGPRYRMDGEVLRDQALWVSGLLFDRIGGPSAKVYQPEGVWEAVGYPPANTTYYKQDAGEVLYRRSMYIFWKRMAPHPAMETFNTPTRETCTVRRERTNTPLQALVTMNEPLFMEAARHLAVNAIHAAGPDAAGRLDFMARRVLARPLTDREKAVLLSTTDALKASFEKKPDDAASMLKVGDSPVDATVPAPEQAAWTLAASTLLNLDEALNK